MPAAQAVSLCWSTADTRGPCSQANVKGRFCCGPAGENIVVRNGGSLGLVATRVVGITLQLRVKNEVTSPIFLFNKQILREDRLARDSLLLHKHQIREV